MFIILFVGNVSAQNMSKEEVKQQAESRLQKMTPDQIDAKIKSLGMTREEAEAKANAYGIDLESLGQECKSGPRRRRDTGLALQRRTPGSWGAVVCGASSPAR